MRTPSRTVSPTSCATVSRSDTRGNRSRPAAAAHYGRPVSDVEIREVDPTDEAELRRWWETGHEAMAGRPYDLRPTWATTRVAMSRPHDDFEQTLWAAYDGDAIVGAGTQMLPIADNLAMAYGDVT